MAESVARVPSHQALTLSAISRVHQSESAVPPGWGLLAVQAKLRLDRLALPSREASHASALALALPDLA